MKLSSRIMVALTAATLLTSPAQTAYAAAGHSDGDLGHDSAREMMDQMREQHGDHEHGHDFEAMEEMSPEQMERMITLMRDVGIVLPSMNSKRGRKLFVKTGCVVCHSVNGVGGEIGPSLNAAEMPSPMNSFEFAARMWRGAAAMTAMQQDMFGDVISLNGQDLADLIAFAHDGKEQKKLKKRQIPKKFRDLLNE